jgi:ATP-dependent Clp protease ATP-binding subunit ClpB
VARLVGAPPGYVGYEEGGQLTEAVRRRPYSVILLDEIEKAHPDVFNILLQILEDGRLTDGQGRTVDLRNTVIIMTSNLGTAVLQDTRIPETEQRRLVMDAVRAHFRPEFLNRVDEIIIFKSLTREQIHAIVNIQLERLRRRLAERRITITLTPAAKELIANEGYDPTYGARPLKRVIQRRLQDPLAMMILEGQFHDGDSLEVDVKDGQLIIKKAGRPAAAAVAGS